MTLTRWDKGIFIAAVLLSSAALLLSGLLMGGERGSMVVIEVAGQIYGRYPLAYKTVELSTPYGSNTVELSPEGVRVTASDCPDQREMREGMISQPGQLLICLPHRLVIRITGGNSDADVNTY